MSGSKYVGRYPDSDSAALPKSYVDDLYNVQKVDQAWIDQCVADQAQFLVTPSYVDTQDALLAKKADVTAADNTKIARTELGVTVASTDNNVYVPSGQIPSGIQTERKVLFKNVDTVFLGSSRTVTTTNPKEFKAATINIPDPGQPYIVKAYAKVAGYSNFGPAGSPAEGTGLFGQMRAYRASDDRLFGWTICTASRKKAWYDLWPYAGPGDNPSTQPLVNGAMTLDLYFSCYTGNSYTFTNEGFTYYVICYPGL